MSYHLIVHLKAKGTATFGRTKWRFCTLGLGRVGHSVVVYDRPHCSIDREFTVSSPELLRPAGWGCYAGPTGILSDPGRSVGTASNLEDALAIHRGEHSTIRWRSTAKSDEIRQSRSS